METAFAELLARGVPFVDTAEAYGFGLSGEGGGGRVAGAARVFFSSPGFWFDQRKRRPPATNHPSTLPFLSSEQLISEFASSSRARPVIATKFAPLPWRRGPDAVVDALRASLERLAVDRVGLYQIHWPGVLGTTEGYVQGLADCLDAGLTVAGGVSNFKPSRVAAAAAALAARGHALASNQIQYSLLYRGPEVEDTVAATK